MTVKQITNVNQLVIGKKYNLSAVAGGFWPFAFPRGDYEVEFVGFDDDGDATVVFPAGVDFNSRPVIQCFNQAFLNDNDFIITEVETKREPVPASQLSPQCRQILRHLHQNPITQRTALMDHGIMALPRRIADLKEAGYKIESTMKKHPVTGQRYASYYLAS